jgi:cytochrome c oxidase subunit 3
MLFVSLFWAYFHSSLSPAIELGSWPAAGLDPVNPWGLPLLGSSVLLCSGFLLTLGHHGIIKGEKDKVIGCLALTKLLGVAFLVLQYNEYYFGQFTIADSVYGSVFYLTTGLHAIHVLIGLLFLALSLFRIILDSFTTEHHLA